MSGFFSVFRGAARHSIYRANLTLNRLHTSMLSRGTQLDVAYPLCIYLTRVIFATSTASLNRILSRIPPPRKSEVVRFVQSHTHFSINLAILLFRLALKRY